MLNGKVKAGKMDDVDVMTRCNQTFMIKSGKVELVAG